MKVSFPPVSSILVTLLLLESAFIIVLVVPVVHAFSPGSSRTTVGQRSAAALSPPPPLLYMADWKEGEGEDPNLWMNDNSNNGNDNNDNDFNNENNNQQQPEEEDWQAQLARKKDGSFWSEFEPLPDDDDDAVSDDMDDTVVVVDGGGASPEDTIIIDESEAWLETLAALQAEEVTFTLKEADRADKARQMEEWGFDAATIQSTLDIAVDTNLETAEEVDGMQAYREASYLEEEDLSLVESHQTIARDPDNNNEPVRSQMVYVDEHACIGCTNCAMIAQSTFFMDQEHGRARVFDQWGDDDETIEIAIQTCPVDCIHYVPYEELVRLEVDRRGQNINSKARLVNQQESSGFERGGGAVAFTAPQRISGNMGSRCNNCPSNGCKSCPMYGVGKNPEFERKESDRKARAAKRRLTQERERDNKSADL